ncbi:chitin deacetylase 2 [Diutina catenulata]
MKFVFVMAVAAAVTPFPSWLTEFTGLTEWPGMDPPYIPLDFINFNAVPNVPLHPQTDCTRVRNHCSFDCFHCVTADEVYTCPVLSQTFDDGPTPHTNTLLDSLSHPTTFFTLGINVVRWPEIYQRAMREGHLMASHTWSHKYLPSLTNEQIVAQLQWSIWAQNATGNHLPKWFRPPFGGIDNRVRAILRQFGMQAVLWDFDTFDWRLLTDQGHHHEEVVYRDLAAFRRDRGGRGLILEHDHSEQMVRVAINIDKRIVGGNQWAVNQCVNNPLRYIKEF